MTKYLYSFCSTGKLLYFAALQLFYLLKGCLISAHVNNFMIHLTVDDFGLSLIRVIKQVERAFVCVIPGHQPMLDMAVMSRRCLCRRMHIYRLNRDPT